MLLFVVVVVVVVAAAAAAAPAAEGATHSLKNKRICCQNCQFSRPKTDTPREGESKWHSNIQGIKKTQIMKISKAQFSVACIRLQRFG